MRYGISVLIIIIISISFIFYSKNKTECSVTLGNSHPVYGKLVKYSKGCFIEGINFLSNNHKRDYCIYNYYENKTGENSFNEIFFYENRFIYGDMIFRQESFLENNKCDSYIK